MINRNILPPLAFSQPDWLGCHSPETGPSLAGLVRDNIILNYKENEAYVMHPRRNISIVTLLCTSCSPLETSGHVRVEKDENIL